MTNINASQPSLSASYHRLVPTLFTLDSLILTSPQNKQIDVALNSALESKVLATPSKKLSPEGQKIAGDIKDVIEAAKILILTKNEGNLFQDFIWQTQQISGGTAEKPNVPIDKQSAKQQANEALEGLRTLGQLLITNGQFRKLRESSRSIFWAVANILSQRCYHPHPVHGWRRCHQDCWQG